MADPITPSQEEPILPPRLVVGRGARAIEQRLLEDAARAHESFQADPRRLSHPVWIVVSSGAQRLHLQRRLLQHLGQATLGISVRTSYQLAREVIERGGLPVPRAETSFDAWVQRAVDEEPLLRERLGRFEDATLLATATIRDLLDAGLNARTAAVIEEANAAADPQTAALLRAAMRVRRHLQKVGIGGEGEVYETAALALERGAELPGHPSLVMVHGFAEATGRVSRLLVALARKVATRAYLDEPPDPADPAQPDLGATFVTRLRRRLAQHLPEEETLDPADPAQLRGFVACGTEAEVREVVLRVRGLLDQGVVPEDVAVVARQLDPYAAAIRRQFRETGVPFGGSDAPASLHPLRRLRAALLRWLREGREVALDTLADLDERTSATDRIDHANAVREAGYRRLEEFISNDSSSTEDALAAARERARRVHDLGTLPSRGRAQRHLAFLREAIDVLSPRDGRLAPKVHELCDKLESELPPEIEWTREEFVQIVDRGSRPWCQQAMGGAGVRVLDALAARGTSARHLFVLGLEQDRFPRVVHEDPLLSDAMRWPLRKILPELSLKKDGHREERWLFAHLCSSAERVTLSWQKADDEGKERNHSPFLSRLPGEGLAAFDKRPRLFKEAFAPGDPRQPRLELEALRYAAIEGRREDFVRALPGALERAAELLEVPAATTAHELARARAEVLDHVDRRRQEPARIDPWSGIVGTLSAEHDPARRDASVTRLESVARCAWRTFVEKILGVKPPRDPWNSLPSIDSLLLGNTVHRALELLFGRDAYRGFELKTPREPAPQRDRPDREAVRRAVVRAVRENTIEAWIGWPGFARALAQRTELRVRRAIECEWRDGGPRVFHCEASDHVDIGAGPEKRTLRFKADRVDAVEAANGAVRLEFHDYKTGQPLSKSKDQKRRNADLLRAVRRGLSLQAAAYASSHEGARGRYLWLPEDGEPESLSVKDDDGDVAVAFEDSASVLLEALSLGVLPPRLLDPRDVERPTEPKSCSYCDVSIACVRGDTNAQRCLAALAAKGRATPKDAAHPAAAHERLLGAQWYLGEDEPEEAP